MIRQLKHYIQSHDFLYESFYSLYSRIMSLFCVLTPVKKNRMIFCSLAGRNYDDSPRAIYEEIIQTRFFDDWELIWAFRNPEQYEIPKGRSIYFGNLRYWYTLFSSKVWIGNGGIDRGLDFSSQNRVVVNTWHGSVLKKSEGEENTNPILRKYRSRKKLDTRTIRCAQNDFDIETYVRLFRATKDCFLKSGLPRNDILLQYTSIDKSNIRKKLKIHNDKKVILYMPTYREYLINDSLKTYIAPPLSIENLKKKLGDGYVFIIRAHYHVNAALNIETDDFCIDASQYFPLSELYYIADILITDYSSCFYDYSILGKPILCFAYDREEYESKRGLYINLEDVMPCGIQRTEEELIHAIVNIDYSKESKKVENFRQKWLPYYGNASKAVIDKIIEMLKEEQK